MENTSDHRGSHLLQLPGGSWDGVPGLQKGKPGRRPTQLAKVSRGRLWFSLLRRTNLKKITPDSDSVEGRSMLPLPLNQRSGFVHIR